MEVLLIFLSGIITGLPFVFPALSFLGYVALIPLCLVLFSRIGEIRARRALLWGVVYGMGFFLVVYHWFLAMYPLDFLGFSKLESFGAVLFCWIGVSFLETLHFLLLPLLMRALRVEKAWLKPFVLAALWVLFEWSQTLTWAGLPWSKLAVGQYTDRVALQTVSLFGSYGFAFVIVLINGFLALAILHLPTRKMFLRYAALALGMLCLNHGIGGVLLLTNQTSDTTVQVAAVQANVGSVEKWNGTNLDVVELYVEHTRVAAANGAKIVVWPETVITTALYGQKKTLVQNCAAECDVIIVFGCFLYETNEDGERESYNAMAMALPDGSIATQMYRKQKLVPFGEYLPMRWFIENVVPVFAEINVMGSHLSPGAESTPLSTPYGEIGGMICYDSVFETVALDAVRAGAQLLVLITNDSWYGDSVAMAQHHASSVVRAVEQGRYLVTSASTGISAVISSTGEILDFAEAQTEDVVYGAVSFESGRTLYSYVGNIFVPASAVFCAVLLALRIYREKKKKTSV